MSGSEPMSVSLEYLAQTGWDDDDGCRRIEPPLFIFSHPQGAAKLSKRHSTKKKCPTETEEIKVK